MEAFPPLSSPPGLPARHVVSQPRDYVNDKALALPDTPFTWQSRLDSLQLPYVDKDDNSLFSTIRNAISLNNKFAKRSMLPICKEIYDAFCSERNPADRLHGLPIALVRKHGELAAQCLIRVWELYIAFTATPFTIDADHDPIKGDTFGKLLRDVALMRVHKQVLRAMLEIAFND
ncbi:hypothetical protein BGZ63DRAFT_20639 [Mariannaea sp. PMI_226]|nr:hypothetical protein BGZ63DRAFT_20639 [Mariannaea sp. PMI_226]